MLLGSELNVHFKLQNSEWIFRTAHGSSFELHFVVYTGAVHLIGCHLFCVYMDLCSCGCQGYAVCFRGGVPFFFLTLHAAFFFAVGLK